MVQGSDLTKQIIGKRVRLVGPTLVEGKVVAVAFQDYGTMLTLEGVAENFSIIVTILDTTEVEVLSEES